MALLAQGCYATPLGVDTLTVRRVTHHRVLAGKPPATTATAPDPTARPAPPLVGGEAAMDGGTVAASPPTTTKAPFREEIETWRPYVAVHFRGVDVDRVLALIDCESDGRSYAANPNPARNGMFAKGLLQHLDGYWPDRADQANRAGYWNTGDIWNPIDQLAVSAWLAYHTPQGFDHWSCTP